MEDVLEVYHKPYDKSVPVVCMDEKPIQLLKEVNAPIAATKDHAKRVDYEYERAGTASIFMFTEALAGKRWATARPQRTKVDWAIEMKHLIDTQYAHCDKIILVCDNLNTHTRGAFYEAFPANVAQALVKRIEFHYTPKHGSWLNVAECELSAMTSQCLSKRRISDIQTLSAELTAWTKRTNQKQKGVNWQFSIDEARTKLKSIYPQTLA